MKEPVLWSDRKVGPSYDVDREHKLPTHVPIALSIFDVTLEQHLNRVLPLT
ncbi:hypothetical protein IFR05_014311 [Cadophora sp. M221]|nr:hypothetical protein IFR05_014311 [Cadophora sp. M221]